MYLISYLIDVPGIILTDFSNGNDNSIFKKSKKERAVNLSGKKLSINQYLKLFRVYPYTITLEYYFYIISSIKKGHFVSRASIVCKITTARRSRFATVSAQHGRRLSSLNLLQTLDTFNIGAILGKFFDPTRHRNIYFFDDKRCHDKSDRVLSYSLVLLL